MTNSKSAGGAAASGSASAASGTGAQAAASALTATGAVQSGSGSNSGSSASGSGSGGAGGAILTTFVTGGNTATGIVSDVSGTPTTITVRSALLLCRSLANPSQDAGAVSSAIAAGVGAGGAAALGLFTSVEDGTTITGFRTSVSDKLTTLTVSSP